MCSITGKASANEEVWLSSSFELDLPVSEGRYSREFKGIHFPRGEKVFTATAENIKNIRGSIYPVFWQKIEYPFEGPLNTTNGVATFSLALPTTWHGITVDIYGRKDIGIYGDAVDNASTVNFKTETSIKVIADSNGDFSLDINTEGVPAGEFLITAGGVEKSIYIGIKPTPTPSSTPLSTPVEPPSPAPVTPPKPSQRWVIPGYEAAFAIASLLAVAYLLVRRDRGSKRRDSRETEVRGEKLKRK